MITASDIYDYHQCPHKVWRDNHGPQCERIEESNPFVELLWEKGVQHEKKVIEQIGEYLDLSQGSLDKRENLTLEAMKNHIPLIYQGALRHRDLLGIPDLLIWDDGHYYPIDIKSGLAMEETSATDDSKRPKRHYAVQLALYVDILIQRNWLTEKVGYIIDGEHNRVLYDLDKLATKRPEKTYWEFYLDYLSEVRLLKDNLQQNLPAMASICKLCHWYHSCKTWVDNTDDLTQLYRCGRSNRDVFKNDLNISSVNGLLTIDLQMLKKRKRTEKGFLKGIGEKTLETLTARAEIYSSNQEPVIYNVPQFPNVNYELFFDIEDDPTQEFVYMHGVYERSHGGKRFIHFTAEEISDTAERDAWKNFWSYIRTLPENDFAVYYFSHHEKTTYLKLQEKYPEVIREESVRAFFDNPNVIDLYRIIDSDTDWPLSSYSLKEIATYLGFQWRDETPSGALSIKWFNEYIITKDPKILTRILEYNEDDCKATMVVKDYLQNLKKSFIVGP